MIDTSNVSVVIPTIGRESLARATESVRQQSGVTPQLLIVADLSADDPRAAALQGDETDAEVVFTGGGHGAAYARNMGIQRASGDWIAFLDDDDYWEPAKSQTQLRAASLTGATVLSCRAKLSHALDERVLAHSAPKRTMSSLQQPADYLFRRRPPTLTRPALYAPTLVVRRDLALEVPWNESLPRHQDWDWIIRLAQHRSYSFFHVPETLATITVGSKLSISARSDWESSLAWARDVLRHDHPSAYVDFLVAQVLRYALQDKSLDGIRAVWDAIIDSRKLPSLASTTIGLSGVLGRRGFEGAMRAHGSRRRGEGLQR